MKTGQVWWHSGAMGCSSCVPTEDAVQALIDHLVYPLLPAKDTFSSDPPSPAQQKSVATQVHAVVILYNYYHRKQFPQLQFLDFKSFCKSACIAKPSLLTYMKFMLRPEEVPSNTEQFSITEQKIWDACNICNGLDMSRDMPMMGSYPVSKVAVLLVDYTKMNCFLQFSSVTQGVWSPIEKDVEKSFDNQINDPSIDGTYMKKDAHGHSETELLTHGDVFQQLAFSAVKEKAGINEEELTILEWHIAYSLSQHEATTQFYLMQYIGTARDKITEFSIKDVVGSLRGPLLSKDLTVTPVVEYFHLMPYMDILSDWLCRQKTVDGLSFSMGQQGNLAKTIEAEGNLAEIIEVGKSYPIEDFEGDRSFSTGRSEKNLERKPNGVINIQGNDSSSAIRSSGAACRAQNEDKDCYLKYPQQETLSKDESKVVENLTENEHAEKGGKIFSVSGTLEHGDGFTGKVDLDSLTKKPCNVGHTVSKSSPKSEACNTVFSGQVDRVVTDIPLVTRPSSPQSGDKSQLAPMPFDSQCGDKFQAVIQSKKRDLSEASLRVLWRKREELYHQQCILEDEIAQCEMTLQKILAEDEGDNLMLKFDSIIEACDSLCLNQACMGKLSFYVDQSRPEKNKRRRLSEAVSLQSTCQEVEDICCGNNWILPRYSIVPSFKQGGYWASVVVNGPQFECKADGDVCSGPREARDSAASRILSILRGVAGHAQ